MMQDDMGLALLVLRCLMLIVITVTLGVYHDPAARRRPCVSLFATFSAGSSLAWAVYSALMALHHDSRGSGFYSAGIDEIWPTLFVLCVMIPILYTKGNVAKLLPRLPWTWRP